MLRPYALTVAVAIVAHALVGPSHAWAPYVLVSVLAAAAAFAGLRRNAPEDRWPWRLMVLGLGLSVAGSIVWYVREWDGRDPSVAHGLYLLAYVASVLAAWLVGRHRPDAERAVTLLDTAIIVTGAAILMWVFVAAPTWHSSAIVGAERAVRATYPMINLAILAAMVRLAFGGGTRVRAYWLLVGGLVGFFLADLLFAVTALYGAAATGASGSIRLAGLALVGGAALDPSMRDLAVPGPPARVQLSRPRLALLWVASATAPVTLVVKLGAGAGGELIVIAVGALALFTLVVARMWGLLGMLADLVSREHEDRFRALVENADDVILITDPEGAISYVSPSAEHVWGYRPERFAETAWNLVEPSDRRRLGTAVCELQELPPGTTIRLEGRLLHADGGSRRYEATLTNRLDDPAIRGVVVTSRDITVRRELERQLTHRTFHDPLTGLPNRALFADRVKQALGSSRTASGLTAVLVLDVDDFKSVNDTLGHERGDELLRVLGRRLATGVRPQDTVARLGGDEFGILLPDVASLDDVTTLATRVLETIAEPVSLEHGRLEPHASLGIATSSFGVSADDLLRDADAAMYAAKSQDKGGFRLFDPTLHAEAVERIQLKLDLRNAVDRGELAVVYQPIHELADEQMVGVEALLRWHHPTRGTISPAEFIPLAEESGSIGMLGEFVLRRACADIAAYRRSTGREVFVTVNVSPLQLYDPAFARTVVGALRDSGLPPEKLTLELTESIFLEQSDDIRRALERLRRAGVHLAIDDFGTGYCSLGYLNRFRFDAVKIDRSFIHVLGVVGGDRRLTMGIMELIGSLEVPGVAEGVETREQLDALRAAGCPFGQGYLWSRPVPIAELPAAAPVASPVRAGAGRP